MNIYEVDLDYESYLFDPQYREDSPQSKKIVNEFEYIFFLINQDPDCALKNSKHYDTNYFDRLKKNGFIIPHLTNETVGIKKWWGNHHNYNLEKELNSKLTSAKLATQHGWGFENGMIVDTTPMARLHVKKNPEIKDWIIKRPFGFSGIGHYQFSRENFNEFIISKIITGPVLIEPLYKRKFDIGTTFVLKNGALERQFMVENFNFENGGFRGGTGAPDVNMFKKYIENKYQYDLSDLEEMTKSIAEEYIKMGAIKNIQIDSFVYEQEGELKLYPLVEVNYRKTMGLVIQSLADKTQKLIEWKVRSKKEIESDPDFFKDQSMIRLSPDGTHFQTYLKYLS